MKYVIFALIAGAGLLAWLHYQNRQEIKTLQPNAAPRPKGPDSSALQANPVNLSDAEKGLNTAAILSNAGNNGLQPQIVVQPAKG